MRFSIVTPSYQSARWLPLCLASVADQQGATFEHIVQDSCSQDGTADLLASRPGVLAHIEKDSGMYDAVNRGLARARGEILSYLNCDEQYLPGTLETVSRFFSRDPRADVLFAGFIVTDAKGRYICSRKVLPPLRSHTRVCHLSPFTCGLFFRRRVLDEHGLRFDSHYRDLGDANWVLQVLEKGLSIRTIPRLTSVYTDTGDNMNLKPNAQQEREEIFQSAPDWERKLVPLIALHHRLRRLFRGVYYQRPFAYKIFTQDSPHQRVTFPVPHPTTMWKDRLTLLR